MRRSILAAVAVTAVLSLTFMVSPASAITGGTPDNGDHPNVGVMYMDNQVALIAGFCSGSLLSADEFLVAGHCTAALSAYVAAGLITKNDVFVSFDETITVTNGVISTADPVAVTGWATDPAYVDAMGITRNDVGVIHLATPQSATPIELPELGFLGEQAASGELRGHNVINVGYGINVEDLDRSLTSPKAVWTWDKERMVSESALLNLASNTLFQENGIGGGDSGGPKFWADGSELVVAITTCGNPTGNLEAAQRLDIEPVLDFLEPYVD